ncbi:methylated-DNA--[protein]-cysteine S-methyltransferase [Vibrio ostreicida]|uniref:Methylated-DNA--protein-cysteine methyltransferase n=1 Tax=Vibrio ostreicida TaxID=526588 RepID=A0ABT8BYJ1_9VIBR|nr:methylated-DNA--[protein]-cysteine S-methyltransferase [Vibrio ostreicida]MDN3612136.1 methylated-DNA--[protein]-cysteine S-methyltransferase [Vibrio ostreicida]NPD08535.1 methylated-DNA--[protein]-cysteine S-methyltransferase [Vibrio ostreicida]
MKKSYTTFDSPLGMVTVQANELGLTGVWFETQTTQPEELGTSQIEHPILIKAIKQLQEYFLGERQEFDLPLSAEGTRFQKQVWKALTEIPFGEAWSYQQLAEMIGNPKAVRAVGAANGKNPISIIVPCHRVIGKNGQMTGYAGGLERKVALLNIEHWEPE